MVDDARPIIIRKVVKKGGRHGGSWKVALADFATAMMAFFLALWILGMTDEEQQGAIAEYFNNPSRVPGNTDVPNTNPVHGPGGAMDSMIELDAPAIQTRHNNNDELNDTEAKSINEETVKKLAAEQELKKMEDLRDRLSEQIKSSKSLSQFSEQIKIDIVPDGLRIQIVDKDKRPMFDLGSDKLKKYTRNILETVAGTINTVPNRISITGHTDAHKYTYRNDYTNWELSSDRANSARRALLSGGLISDKVSKVIGRGSSVPLHPDDPYAPDNRRISIIVLNSEPVINMTGDS